MSTLTPLRRASLAAQSEAAQQKRSATIAAKRELLEQDILLLWQRGLVPLAIASKLSVPVDRVTSVLREAGRRVPMYMTSTGPTPEADSCPHCGRAV